MAAGYRKFRQLGEGLNPGRSCHDATFEKFKGLKTLANVYHDISVPVCDVRVGYAQGF